MSETTSICSQVDKALWENDRKYCMAGKETPFRTVVFCPEAYANFRHELARHQMAAMDLGTKVKRYRGATIGVVHNQQEHFRVVER
jgi:hypothetical protein